MSIKRVADGSHAVAETFSVAPLDTSDIGVDTNRSSVLHDFSNAPEDEPHMMSGPQASDTYANGTDGDDVIHVPSDIGVYYYEGGTGEDTLVVDFSEAIGSATAVTSPYLVPAPSADGYGGIFSTGFPGRIVHYLGIERIDLVATPFDDQFYLPGTADIVSLGSGNDWVYSLAGGSDIIYGGAGDDRIGIGGLSNDLVDGGTGSDTLSFLSAVAGVRVDLAITVAQNTGGAGTDTYLNIENVLGSGFDDILIGSSGANRLSGWAGLDLLTGGVGADVFAFEGPLGAGNVATITDFEAGLDRIELDPSRFGSLTFAQLGTGAFAIGSAAGDADDRIIYDPTTGALFYDPDGNGAGAAVQFGQLQPGTTLSAQDFVDVDAGSTDALDGTIAAVEDQSYVFSIADFGFSDAEGDALDAVQIVGFPAAGSILYDPDGVGGALSAVPLSSDLFIPVTEIAAGRLIYVPPSNASGTGLSTFTFTVRDNSGVVDETPANVTIDVTAVNDAPVGVDSTIAMTEDGVRILTSADFPFSDPDGDPLAAVAIEGVEGGEVRFDNGSGPIAIATFPFVATVADLAAGRLSFVPDYNANGDGAASILFRVGDGALVDPAPATLLIDLAPVNDAPLLSPPSQSLVSFVENGAARLFQGLTVTDPDTTTFSGGRFTLAMDGPGGFWLSPTSLYSITQNANGTHTLNLLVPFPSPNTPYPVARIVGYGTANMSVQDLGGPFANLLGLFEYRNSSDNPGEGDFVVTLTFNDGGNIGGGALTASQTQTIRVRAENDAPVIDLNGADAGIGMSSSYAEGDAPLRLAVAGTITDVDSANFDGGSLVVAIASGLVFGEDRLVVLSSGAIGMASGAVTYNGTPFGSVSGGIGGTPLSIVFNSAATPAAVAALVRAIAYDNSGSNAPTGGQRTITWTLSDGEGATAPVASSALVVIENEEAASAAPDGFSTNEATIVTGNLFADNGAGADNDPDGPALSVVAVNGAVGNVGGQVTLASGALLTVNADGTFSYDPNDAFDLLPAPGVGVGPFSTIDSFTYTLAGGGSTTVTITIAGIDSDDVITGTAAGDVIDGGIGNDRISGLDGNDRLNGGGGDDALVGGLGDDFLDGGADNDQLQDEQGGSDQLFGGTGFNWYIVSRSGSGPADTILIDGRGGSSLVNFSAPDRYLDTVTILGGPEADDISATGGALLMIDAGAGDDRLSFVNGLGHIVLTLGDGADELRVASSAPNHRVGMIEVADFERGEGGDRLYLGPVYETALLVQAGSDVVFRVDPDGVGPAGYVDSVILRGVFVDRIRYDNAGGYYFALSNIAGTGSDDTLTGTNDADTIDGLGGNDTIFGLGGGDTLYGGAGNDALHGGAGNDWLEGGAGDDVYYVDSAGDVVVEAAGGGSDRIYAGGDYTLYAGQHIEVLSTDNDAGTAAIALGGNELNNIIYGNAGNNLLYGKGGNDYLAGLGGNDVYYVDSAGDVVVEAAGGGSDRIYAGGDYTLYAGQHIEILSTDNDAGTAAIALGGNELNNIIYGNAGDNLLYGKGGSDWLEGLGGNDVYYVDSAGDVVAEAAGGGSDRIYAGGDYTLYAGQHIEVLSTDNDAGTAAIALGGNELNNIIYGNAGNNILYGKGGNDWLEGLGGNDVYYVDSAGDVVAEAAGGGNDRIYASADYTLYAGQHVEILSTDNDAGTAAIALGGNELNNIIYGNAGNNILYSKGGNDTLIGGDGNDTLIGGDGNDQFHFTTALGAGNVDQIADFAAGDIIVLGGNAGVGSSRVDLQACKLEYSIVSPK